MNLYSSVAIYFIIYHWWIFSDRFSPLNAFKAMVGVGGNENKILFFFCTTPSLDSTGLILRFGSKSKNPTQNDFGGGWTHKCVSFGLFCFFVCYSFHFTSLSSSWTNERRYVKTSHSFDIVYFFVYYWLLIYLWKRKTGVDMGSPPLSVINDKRWTWVHL